jgi:hypothetical protein
VEGKINTVIGVEKVPVSGRKLYSLVGTDALFTGEHPFMMADGKWGSFDKQAMDQELVSDHISIVETQDGMFQIKGDFNSYDENTVTQIKNGDLGVNIQGESTMLSAIPTKVEEEFVYTMFMDGDRTWNIEGIVISGLALTGDNPQLVEVT